MPKDEPLKRCVMRANLALEVSDALRERVLRQPRLDLAIVKGVRHAEHFGAWVLGVVVRTG
jgi:hypothetical protein